MGVLMHRKEAGYDEAGLLEAGVSDLVAVDFTEEASEHLREVNLAAKEEQSYGKRNVTGQGRRN